MGEVVEEARLQLHAADARHVAHEALHGEALEALARGLVGGEVLGRDALGGALALAGELDDAGAQARGALGERRLGRGALLLEALGGAARVLLGALEASQALGQRAELELALLDALGERGELLLEVADLAVGVLALVGQGLDLRGLLAVVREVGAGVGDLDLGVLALADDARELAGDLLGREGDGLEARLLRHGGERGGALEQLEVELLDLHEGGCFSHLRFLSLSGAARVCCRARRRWR